jgi:hypothetical protein
MIALDALGMHGDVVMVDIFSTTQSTQTIRRHHSESQVICASSRIQFAAMGSANSDILPLQSRSNPGLRFFMTVPPRRDQQSIIDRFRAVHSEFLGPVMTRTV